MKILYIDPVAPNYFTEGLKDYLDHVKDVNIEINAIPLPRGPGTLEFRYYESLVVPDIIHKIIEAERTGYDGAIIGCFYDPGLYTAREVSTIPVVGPGESSMYIASILGDRFSIIVGKSKWIPIILENIKKYGLKERLSSFRSETYERMVILGEEAIEKDGAEVIILSCTSMYGFHRELQKELKVPVIDPVISAIEYAQFLVKLKQKFGWAHSKIRSFQGPKSEEIRRWKIPEQYSLKNIWDIKEGK